jgi:membrane protease YdiL (CAAX protease family)
MQIPLPPPTADWNVFRLLWKTARRRAAGRSKRQSEIMRRKKGSDSDFAGSMMALGAILMAGFVHGMLGWVAFNFAIPAIRSDVEGENLQMLGYPASFLLDRVVQKQSALAALQQPPGVAVRSRPATRGDLPSAEAEFNRARDDFVNSEASWRVSQFGGTEESHRRIIAEQYRRYGKAGFVHRDASFGTMLIHARQSPTVLVPLVGGVLVWWLAMLVFQGEGLELDVQRRRHPMWEWLLCHPVRPGAAFYAEMLAPLVANPVYLAAPIFWCVVLSSVHGFMGGFVGAFLIGLPLAIAASCLNKALEITALLRLSSRSRGAVLGIMSWFGYIAMFLPFFGMQAKSLIAALVKLLAPLRDWMPAWPVRALTVGWGETPSLPEVVVTGWAIAAILIVLAIAIARSASRAGLQAAQGSTEPGPASASRLPGSLGRNPLYRKELLWLLRDKGAVVQAVLIPLTLGAFQAFNFRGLYDLAGSQWNAFCGMALLCGTYFLLVLGPRSLTSEGASLWLALTWPRGLEDLLKSKARLWWIVSNVVVGILLIVAVCMFPADAWRIALVAVGWYFFSHSLALKSVTLVNAPSSSGEPEPVSRGRQWTAMLGTFAFGTGVITQSWHLAIIGVVFSYLMAATMWQNLRARLPYLYDPWSEKLPPAPSLLHATVGIMILVETVSICAGFALGAGGIKYFWLIRTLAYGIVGLLVWIGMDDFLKGRGVTTADVWLWPRDRPIPRLTSSLAAGLGAGALLGLLARGYMTLLAWLPLTRDYLAEQARLASTYQNQFIWLYLLGVVMAPFVEEYFFRGLLYRALDREWGGWAALALSSAYFAIYHPPVAWIPVAGLGLLNAVLFKRTGRLVPCVLCHMAYNAVVLLR